MTFTAEATNSGGELFATFKVDASSLHYPLGVLFWGADSGSIQSTDTGAPLPVRIYGNTSGSEVYVTTDSGSPPAFQLRSGANSSSNPVVVGNSSSFPLYVTTDSGQPPDISVRRGQSSNGAAATQLPLTISGADGSSITRRLLVDSSGAIQVSGYVAPSTTVTVTGYTAPSTTVTVTGYTAPSTTVTITNPTDTTVTVTGYTAPSTTVTVTNIASNDTVVTVTNPTDTTVTVTGYVAPSTTVTVTDLPTNTVDSQNTSSTALSSGAAFTGTGTDVSAYSAVTVHVRADEPSAASGMSFQFSPDNSNWNDAYNFSYSSNDTGGARRFQFPVTAQYFRTVYTNGSTAQSSFHVQTILHRSNVLTSIHRMGDTGLSADRSGTVTKSALIAQRGGTGNFIPVAASANGNLRVDIEEAQNDSSTPLFVSNSSTNPLYVTAPVTALSVWNGLVSSAATTVFSSAARLHGYHIGNPDTAANIFLKIYDDTGSPTLGTDTADMDLFVPFGGGAVVPSLGPGLTFSSGLVLAAAATAGDTVHDSPSTSLSVTLWYTQGQLP